MKYIAIHQPNFIPWIGFFHKMCISDIFIFLDDAQFSKGDYHNRNYMDANGDTVQLTIPVYSNSSQEKINEKEICYMRDWKTKHLKSLFYNYKNSKNFFEIYNIISEIYKNDQKYLSSLNIEIIDNILSYLDIHVEILKASQFNISAKKTDRIIEICKRVKGDAYIYGGGSHYLDIAKFVENDILPVSQKFIEPTYDRGNKTKTKNLSMLDYLFYTDKSEIQSYFFNEREKIREKEFEFIT